MRRIPVPQIKAHQSFFAVEPGGLVSAAMPFFALTIGLIIQGEQQMKNKTVTLKLVLPIGLMVLMAVGTVSNSRALAQTPRSASSSFAVTFGDCLESIGVTLLPTASVRALVPQSFILAGDGQPVTPVVVRTAHCQHITTDGHGQRPGDIVQIGAVVVPPDFTGDINNYTIWYYTSDLRLALRLLENRVDAQYVPTMDYDFEDDDDTLLVRVPLPGFPRLVVSGSVVPSSQPAGSFVANWWREVNGRKVKMSTVVPSINIGSANLTLTTNPNGALGQLIGGSATGFPILQQFNSFATATMNVSSN
jgi:hypothetical protein